MRVAVYGTLKRGSYNNQLLLRAGGRFVGTAVTVHSYLLLCGPYPALVPPQYKVPEGHVRYGRAVVELWDVDDITVLDRLEGYLPNDPAESMYHRVETVSYTHLRAHET